MWTTSLRCCARGNAHAVQRVRRAGFVLGSALAQAVSLLNPSQIVVAGSSRSPVSIYSRVLESLSGAAVG